MTYAEAEERSRRLAKRMIARGDGQGHPRRPVLHLRPGVGDRVARREPDRRARDAARDHVPTRPRSARCCASATSTRSSPRAPCSAVTCSRCWKTACPASPTRPRRRCSCPMTPSLRAVWITGGTDRAWATRDRARGRAGRRSRAIDDELLAAMEAEVVPADLAQVTYTSGSSADPKGVVHTHATVLRGTYWFGDARGADADGGETKIFCIVPVLLDRRHAHPRRRDPVGPHRALHRAVRAGRGARHHRSRAGDHGRRLADAHAVDARPPDRSRPQAPGDRRPHRRAGRRRARRRHRCRASPGIGA